MCGQEIFKKYSDIFKIVELFQTNNGQKFVANEQVKKKFNIFKFNNFHVHVFLLSLHSNENYPPLKL